MEDLGQTNTGPVLSPNVFLLSLRQVHRACAQTSPAQIQSNKNKTQLRLGLWTTANERSAIFVGLFNK